MTSGSTREFMALHAIATHFGRPGVPTDQAPVESFFGHLKHEWPHLCHVTDAGDLDHELGAVRRRYNGVRLHAGIGYVTPDDEHKATDPPSATPAASASPAPAKPASPTIAVNDPTTRHEPPVET
jgi:transposase InsO family protein